MHNGLSNKLSGWFAIGTSRELLLGDTKIFFFGEKSLIISRKPDGIFSDSNVIKEQNGIIFFWNHHTAPAWELPAIDESEWSPFLSHQLKACTHPQEVYENSIDQSHFAFVHGFKNLSLIEEPSFKNHMMQVQYRIRRKNIFFTSKWLDAYFTVSLYGLGCAYNDIHIPTLNLHIKMLALTTPIQNGLVNIHLAVAIKQRKSLLLFKSYLHKLIFKNIIHDFCQDVAIWENKCYRSRPLLVRGDGNIIQFRNWCQQFYE